MSSNDQTVRDSEVGLDEPHFDEEATLLAARPVVPLGEVKETTRSKARWALMLAIVGGLLIGLLGATFLYRYLGSSEPRVAEAPAVAEQPAEPQTSAGGTISVAEETAAEEKRVEPSQETQPQSQPETKPASVTTDATPAKAEPPTRAPKPRPVIVDRSEEEEMQEREVQRARRQQERREERRAAREARRDNRQRAQTNDDLLRIREIFEGAPRP